MMRCMILLMIGFVVYDFIFFYVALLDKQVFTAIIFAGIIYLFTYNAYRYGHVLKIIDRVDLEIMPKKQSYKELLSELKKP